MLKKIKEKLHNRAYLKWTVTFLISVVFIVLASAYLTAGDGQALKRGLVAAAIYVFALAVVFTVWNLIEKNIAKKRGLEIEPLLGNMTLDILPRLYMPVIISDKNGRIIWFNQTLGTAYGSKNGLFGKNIEQICSCSFEEIMSPENKDEGVGVIAFNNFYKVRGYQVKTSDKEYCITVWNNQNKLNEAYKELKDENLFLDQMSVVSKKSSGRIRMEFKAFRKEQVDAITRRIQQINGVREVKKS